MHEVVHSSFDIRRLRSLRRPSFAGNGLPERMRSTAFAFLGLTAALGLALVATFAQLSFPVLSPAPPPGGPIGKSSLSEAVALRHSPSVSVPSGRRTGGPAPGLSGNGPAPLGPRADGQVAEPVQVASPAPAPASEPSTGGGPGDPGPSPAPAPSSSPASAPPSPQPDPAVPPKPAPTPARPAAVEPSPGPAPGNSQSSAAAEHASERGIEASSKSSAAAAAPEAEAESDAAPGNGNGKALGHHK